MKQLTSVVRFFYSVDHLHCIAGLTIKPLASSKLLDISMTVEAVSMTGAPARETLAEPPADRSMA
ncbi:MAG: hypothetical protein H6821_12145 [Planctomycetaceae bacterium]|nr:hypothetical protein [Planctomycetaceae bacterium]